MKKRLFSSILLVSVLAGCANNNSTNLGPTQIGEVTTPITKPTVHEGVYNIIDSSNVFYDGVIQYKVITKENETNNYISKSVNLLTSQIFNALGKEINISYDNSINVNDYNIVVNRDDLLIENHVEISEKIKECKVGYQITTVGNTVFIYGTNSEAIRLAIIRFLSFTIGYDCLGENVIIFEKDGKEVNSKSVIYMPDFHLVEKPDYEYRSFSNGIHDDEDFFMGFSDVSRNEIANYYTGGFHNSITKVIPLSEYKTTHPKFYNNSFQQICYTAHGDKNEYNLMVDVAASNLVDIAFLPTNVNLEYIPFCHEDVNAQANDWCKCDACMNMIKTYSPKSLANVTTYIPFMNDVTEAFDRKIAARCEELGIPKRKINIFCIVYHRSQSLTTPDEPIDLLKFDDRLKVLIAPIQFKYDRSFNDLGNSYCKEQVERWALFSNNLGTWSYQVNFGNYLCPYNTFDTAIDYYRLFFNNGSTFMLNEGYWGMGQTSSFTAFKDYIDSKCLIDLTVEYSKLEERFFKYYYGDAGDFMKKMYKEIVANCIYARENDLTDGGIKSENASYYSFSTALRFADYIDNSYDAIEPLKLTDLDYYQHIFNNIETEGVFPHYLLTLKMDDYLSNEMRNKYRNLLYLEATDCSIDEVYENGPRLSSYFTEWGF